MESGTEDLILLTLPSHLKDEGLKLIEKYNEDIEPGGHSNGRACLRRGSGEALPITKNHSESKVKPIVIGRLITELWSPRMRKHAETLMLQKAMEEEYLVEDQLKWVHVLEDQEKNEMEMKDTWLIDDQDDAIVTLVWYIFNMKEHYSQVHSHRTWVMRSYHRLKDYLPNLSEEIMERHDLSKYAFSQAVGYTLKWVHKKYCEIWRHACDFHLHNEPHHAQTWSNRNTPQQKREKLLKWVCQASDLDTGLPYGIDINNYDYSTEDLAEPFLLESYVDMVGVEWERKKGKDMNILTSYLAYIADRFLTRYSKRQRHIVKTLIAKITASEQLCELSERENILMGTTPPEMHGLYAMELDDRKKIEERRMIENSRQDSRKRENVLMNTLTPENHDLYVTQFDEQRKTEERRLANDTSFGKTESSDQEAGQLSEEKRRMVQDKAFYIMTAKVVMEYWDVGYMRRIENLIFRKAINEKIVMSNHIDWIKIFNNCPSQVDSSRMSEIGDSSKDDESIVELLWHEFNLGQHFTNVQQHRHWVKQSYMRLSRFMPEISWEVIERHDLTKLALSQSIGYTLKWVHNINLPVWRRACDRHLNWEPHHPQMWSSKHTAEHKQSCLSRWLGGGDRYGVNISTLDLHSEDMARVFLLESLVDMVAIEWERNKEQREDLTYTQLIHMEDRFLNRYTRRDKAIITELMKVIKQADESPRK